MENRHEFLEKGIKERMSILNAYYVPSACREHLYDTISPVNTFRVLLRSLFDEQLECLPDRVLFSWYDNPTGERWEYDIIDATEDLLPKVDQVSTSDKQDAKRAVAPEN